MPGLPRTPRPARAARRRKPSRRRQGRRLLRLLLIAAAGFLVLASAAAAGLYASYARTIDAHLRGERARAVPRVYARPLEIWRGQQLSRVDLVARLNALGYARRAEASGPGEFSVSGSVVSLRPRGGPHAGRRIQVTLPDAALSPGIRQITVDGGNRADLVELDRPVMTALASPAARAKRRHAPLATIPLHVQQAVLAVEDQRFYSHVGVNPLRMAAAAVTNLLQDAPVGNSTITQQLARMIFQADTFNAELRSGTRSHLRYLRGALMSIVLERRASKDEILELYLNDVYLGQRGSFAIHGVGEGARIFFGKDVANLTIGEGALIAGVIQSPASRSPFVHPARAVERRNVVVATMAREGHITASQAEHARREPLRVAAHAVDNDAPYFVDLVAQQVADEFPGVTARPGAVDVHTTLDLNLQRAALDAVRRGLDRVDQLLAEHGRDGRPQVALVALDPRTGEVLALVGGRSYNVSQFNRAVAARRQPGSVVKPFVFLAAFEHAAAAGRAGLTPAAIASDDPRAFELDGRPWEPRNFDDVYEGAITWRRALAASRNLATLDVAARTGFENVAAFWRRIGLATEPKPYPSMVLGAFELSPVDVAHAYLLLAGGGTSRPVRLLQGIELDRRRLEPELPAPVRVARADITFLVTHMMRSVMDDGTGAAARAAGFTREAAGKTGTTNDLRDAWFAGFTPELLAVVWVGFDDNRPLGLAGSEAALPIWTDFMMAGLAGRPAGRFQPPPGVVFADIDPATGGLATPGCPRTIVEAFLAGSEPAAYCDLHR